MSNISNNSDKGIFIFVTAGRWQIPAIKRAKAMGFHCVGIDSNWEAPGLNLSDTRIVMELNELEIVYREIDKLNMKVAGVLSYCSEVGVLAAAEIRQFYKLGYPNASEVSIFLDKSLQRKALDEAGIINPRWKLISEFNETLELEDNFNFPLIVKPTDSSGSRGVSEVNSMEELKTQLSQARKFSRSQNVLIEEFIDGTEYTVEVAAKEKKIEVLLVTRKIKVSNSIRTVASELWSVDPKEEIFAVLRKLAVRVFQIFGLVEGVGHLEAILKQNGDVFVIEAAIRGGGFNLANQMVRATTGFDYCFWCIASEARIKSHEKMTYYKPSVLFFHPSKLGVITKISGISEANKVEGVHVEQLREVGEQVINATTDADRIYSAVIVSDNIDNLNTKKLQVQNMIQVEIS